MDFSKVEIIDMKLSIKELLHIIQMKPTFNKQLNSNSLIKTLLLQAYPQFQTSN